MANADHLNTLKQGVAAWNKWRECNPQIRPDLSEADLGGIDFTSDPSVPRDWEVNFHSTNLTKAILSEAVLIGADFQEADLTEADLMRATVCFANISRACLVRTNLYKADLHNSNLTGANLSKAHLCGADLRSTNFSNADLREADLREAILVETTFYDSANLSGCWIHGISVWAIKVDETTVQSDLVITNINEPRITVDNLEVAQFVYLLLNNKKIRDVIDTIGNKGVLILGRFTPERKAILDAMRDGLRGLGFVPMIFDFERPTQRDFTETIKTLAGMSRFIIADITNPKSSPLELQATVPEYMIPFVPIIHEDEEPFAMFHDLKQKHGEWVLDILEYDSVDNLRKVLVDAVVRPALEKADQLMLKKAEAVRKRHVTDYLS